MAGAIHTLFSDTQFSPVSTAAKDSLFKLVFLADGRPNLLYGRRVVAWKSRTSAVRADCMILLLESKGLFEKFHKEYWPHYETEGRQERVSHIS
jgi:hypothetical protein